MPPETPETENRRGLSRNKGKTETSTSDEIDNEKETKSKTETLTSTETSSPITASEDMITGNRMTIRTKQGNLEGTLIEHTKKGKMEVIELEIEGGKKIEITKMGDDIETIEYI